MGQGLLNFLKNMKKSWKTAFCSTFFIGLLVHMYKFTNTLLNHDSVYNYYSDQNVVGSGRWFLSIACGITSYFDLPWVIGIVSLVFIAATVVLIVDIFEIENPVLIVLSGALLVAFPGITETFFFEYTADGYMLAMFLAALAVWLTRLGVNNNSYIYIYIFRWPLAGLCICLCCGIYQAYVSFGMVLALCYLLCELLEDRHDAKTCWSWAFKQLGLYAVALASYYLIWKLCMLAQSVTPNNYQGISALGFSLNTIIQAIPECIKTLGVFFLEWNVLEHGWTVYGILNVLFLLMAIGILIVSVCKRRLVAKRSLFILFMLALLLIPIATCIWTFTSDKVGYRPMMLVSLCVVYIFIGVLFEKNARVKWKDTFAILATVIVFDLSIISNICYFYMNRTYETTYSMGQEIISRIHWMDAESKDMLVVGETVLESSLDFAPNANRIHILAQLLETNLMYDEEHLIYYLNNTFYTAYDKLDSEERNVLISYNQVQDMPCWPAADSVQLIDDVIVIKLAEEEP